LVDGLGTALLPRLAPHAPLLAGALAGSVGTLRELACTFPSTTPTSLVSLGTGTGPGEHGVLGFTVNVPGTERVLTHILWRDDPPPEQWQPVPTWFERAAAAGIDARVVLPALFGGSGLTLAAYRGARFCGVAKGEDYAGRLVAELLAGPGLVYGYTPALDTAAHAFGIASPQWAAAAAKVDALLARVAEALPADAALLVTADHGGLDVGPAGRVDVAAEPRLAEAVRVVAGEPRVRYLHVRDGAAADVRATWQGVLGADAAVLLREEAIAAGWFGPVADGHRARIGDVIAVCRGDCAVFATDREPPEVAKLVGLHGADTWAETAIPLLTVRG
ncbi:MAG TPA: alkaline phosphatase family protein, partial [Jatrophihabitans sp.]|nr:alkaline phosphatase family protein [Jatrophihabitans sp.]